MYEHSAIDAFPQLDSLRKESSSQGGDSQPYTPHGSCDSSTRSSGDEGSGGSGGSEGSEGSEGESSGKSTRASRASSSLTPLLTLMDSASRDVFIFQKIAQALPVESLLYLVRGAKTQEQTAKDAEVFRNLAQSMPAKSLLHMLHGVTVASGDEGNGFDDDDNDFDDDDKDANNDDKDANNDEVKEQGPRRVRFAPHRRVREVPRLHNPKLWWRPQEMARFKTNCADLADHYLCSQQWDYIEAISRLLNDSKASGTQCDKDFDCLAQNEECRGLERFIVDECQDVGLMHTMSVMQAQEEFGSGDTASELLREASCETSYLSAQLAVKLARYDMQQARLSWQY
jgi:hypothetical protein